MADTRMGTVAAPLDSTAVPRSAGPSGTAPWPAPDAPDAPDASSNVDPSGAAGATRSARVGPTGAAALAKRGLDVAVATGLLVVLAPVLAAVALAVAVESRGPVVFRQRRLGRHGTPFEILKFRTMRPDAETVLRADPVLHAAFLANGCKLDDGADPRVTRVGRFLRRSSLDELPQLVNVLRGEMSVVGPRPPIVEQIPTLYGDDAPVYFAVRPGLTGLWQVSGRSDLTEVERRALDVRYVTTWSFRTDLSILAATVPAVLSRRGAH